MEKIDQFATKLLGYLESTELFLADQMPDFVNQFIAYETWKVEWLFKVWLSLLIILAVVQVINFIVLIVKNIDEFLYLLAWVGILGTISLMLTIGAYKDLKKLEIAPKVYMIEAAKDMIKK